MRRIDTTNSTPSGARGGCTQAEQTAALEKQARLFEILRSLDSLLVAFSGGADSAYLAWAANSVLGEKSLGITALSASFSTYDRQQAESFVRETGIRHEFIHTHEFENPDYTANNADRCYHCKDALFDRMAEIARERNFSAIAYAINADDTHDFRPGHRAAREHRILAPLLDVGLTKAEIRALSRAANLPTWDRPASACLSSRIPYGTPVTPELLAKIEAAEAALRELGFRQFRVRAHGKLARIEIALDEMHRALDPDTAACIAAGVRNSGFEFVTLDLDGYRQGSLNSLLKIQ